MSLSIEQLLAPRYLCTSPYPSARFSVGAIIEGEKAILIYNGRPDYLKAYPSIFQPLPWYSHRKEEDMPEYVMDNYNQVHKVISHSKGVAETEKGYSIQYNKCKPATLE